MAKRLLPVVLVIFFFFGCAGPKRKMETVFYPPLPQRPRLQFLTSITTEEDVGKKKSALMEFLIGENQRENQIARPYDFGSVEGKIYLVDRTYKSVMYIDLVNKRFDFIKAEKMGALSDPAGIWITDDGYKYVADFKRKQVVVFNEADEYVRAYGTKGQFQKPLDVAVHDNRIYVCDFGSHQILVLDKESGNTVEKIGGIGDKEGTLFKPTHVIVDKSGNIYVNDSFNFRIQKFSPSGDFIKVFGYLGDTLGGLARPKGIAIDDEGHLYVADTAFENVQIFDDESTDLLLFFGGFGPQPGSMYMPNAVYIDHKNLKYFEKYADKDFKLKYLLFVGNMLGDHKVNVYGFGDWVGEALPEM